MYYFLFYYFICFACDVWSIEETLLESFEDQVVEDPDQQQEFEEGKYNWHATYNFLIQFQLY